MRRPSTPVVNLFETATRRQTMIRTEHVFDVTDGELAAPDHGLPAILRSEM